MGMPIAFKPAGDCSADRVITAMRDRMVHRGPDGGDNWRKTDKFPGIPENTYVSDVESSPLDADTVFAAFDNHKMGDFKPYLLKSADRGKTWTAIAGDLPERVANDLLEALEDRDDGDVARVRQVAELRFAAQLLPEAFSPYLKEQGSGRFSLARLPAADDPMLRRVGSIRERDQMLVDTLNDHYLTFYEQMSGPYSNWKMYTYDEQNALDGVQRASMARTRAKTVSVRVSANDVALTVMGCASSSCS